MCDTNNVLNANNSQILAKTLLNNNSLQFYRENYYFSGDASQYLSFEHHVN